MKKSVGRCCCILLCLVVLLELWLPSLAKDGLITTQQELLAAIDEAETGDVLLVGHIDFTAPTGFFNEMMRIQLSKSITIRSGLTNEKAVFTNGSFLLRGSKVFGETLQCKFENIIFDGAVDTAALTAADWECPYDELSQSYTCDVPLKAQYAVSFAGNVKAAFSGCVFQNYMYDYGGAMWCRYGDYTANSYLLDRYGDYSGCKLDVTLKNCDFLGNASQYSGGAIYLDGNEDNVCFRAEGCRFESNFSGLSDYAGGGGAVYAQYANLELSDCVFDSNQGNRDWGLYSELGDRTRGGAVHMNNGTLQMENCVVSYNCASVGGGLCLTNTRAMLDGCLLTGNRAENVVPSQLTGPWASVGIGGAMYVETEGAILVSVYNSAIQGNSAVNAYGGVYGFYNEDYAGVLSQGYGRLDFYFCTVAGNTCDTVFDYSDPGAWMWYTHPGDVWRIPYVTVFGCVLQEEGYASDYPRQEEPSAENGYNCYSCEAVVSGDDPYLLSAQWSVPTEAAKAALKGRYGDRVSEYYVGCIYSAELYQPQPSDEPSTDPPITAEPTTPEEPSVESTAPDSQEPGAGNGGLLWLIAFIPCAALLGLGIFLFAGRGREKNAPAPEEKPEPRIVMTRYDEYQIQQIIQKVPQTQRLTARELEVFQEILMGKKQSEIAYDLGISVPTVKDNARRIYDKLEVQNKAELFIKVNTAI